MGVGKRQGQEERRPGHGVGGDGGLGSSSWQGQLRKFDSGARVEWVRAYMVISGVWHQGDETLEPKL